MVRWAALALAAAASIASTNAAATPALAVTWVRWDRATPGPTVHRLGELTVTTRLGKVDQYVITPVLEVSRSGKAPLKVAGVEGLSGEFAVVDLRRDDGDPVILFRTFTGGAHCCLNYKLVRRVSGDWRVLQLGEWDDSTAPVPQDVDGDGRLEFVGRDQRFQYRFDSYAASVAPMVIYVLGEQGLIDVSAQPKYRPAFTTRLADYRKWCETKGRGSENGACAGYVAQAARAGSSTVAFAVLDRAVTSAEFQGPFRVPQQCGGSALAGRCRSEKPEKSFRTLHAALDYFLRDLGYLPPKTGAR